MVKVRVGFEVERRLQNLRPNCYAAMVSKALMVLFLSVKPTYDTLMELHTNRHDVVIVEEAKM